jgi:DNA-binding response OmpR family regulator
VKAAQSGLYGERVVVVEPDPLTRGILCAHLAESGYQPCPVARDSLEAAVRAEDPVAVLLDVAGQGAELARWCIGFRENHDIPLILVTAREDDPTALAALMCGADDYLILPVKRPRLAAKLSAQTRRYAWAGANRTAVIKFRDVEIDVASDVVTKGGDVVSLTRTEYRLLVALARKPGHVVTSSELFQWLWRQPDCGDARSIQVHIRNLRKKIEPNPARPSYVVTVRGRGYKVNPFEQRSRHLA